MENAKWIYAKGAKSPRNDWRIFRKSFELNETPTSAIMDICADSRYALYINDTLIGRGPVRFWQGEVRYDTYQISSSLKKGKNTISVVLVNLGIGTFWYEKGRGGLILSLSIETSQGKLVISSDESFKTCKFPQDKNAPKLNCQQAFTEVIDGNLIPVGFTGNDCDDESFENASIIGENGMEPWGKLLERDIPPLTMNRQYPKAVTRIYKTKPRAKTLEINIRSALNFEAEETAQGADMLGIGATKLIMETDGVLTFAFVHQVGSPVRVAIDGKVYESNDFKQDGHIVFTQLSLSKGEHLFVFDFNFLNTARNIIFGFDSVVNFVLENPSNRNAKTPLSCACFGFEWYFDFLPFNGINRDNADFIDSFKVKTATELVERLGDKLLVTHDEFVTINGSFGYQLWTKETIETSGIKQLQPLCIANNNCGVAPIFDGYDTRFIIDFGKELSGYIEFDILAEKGTVIDFYGFEYMIGDEIQYTLDLNNTLRYTCKNGRQSYTANVYRGFRYIMVTVMGAKKPVEFFGVTVEQSVYPSVDIGTFMCDDYKLNKIWEISRETTRQCMEDTFVDCPAYEQVYWVGDSRNEALINYYVFGDLEIVKRCLNLVPGSKKITGLYNDHLPSSWGSVIPNWTYFYIIACFEYYQKSADMAFIKDMAPKIEHTMRCYLEKINEKGLLEMDGWNFLDWAPMDQPNSGVVSHQNMFLCKALYCCADILDIAGAKQTDYFREQADKLNAAINKYLWNEEKSAYHDSIHKDGVYSTVFSMQTQTAAMLCDIAKDDRFERIAAYLKTPPADFVKIGSPFMAFFYYEVLAKSGEFDYIVEDIRENFGHMTDLGATTCWETYDMNPNKSPIKGIPTTRSHCHAWSAGPAYFLSAYVLGIRSIGLKDSKILISPNPCGLNWVRGRVPIHDSYIEVCYEVIGNKIEMSVKSPSNIELSFETPKGFTLEKTVVYIEV